MNILIGDIGNSNTKLCLVDSETFLIKRTISFNSNYISSFKFLKKTFSRFVNDKFTKKSALFSSVVPKHYLCLKRFLSIRYKIRSRELKENKIKKIVKINIKLLRKNEN